MLRFIPLLIGLALCLGCQDKPSPTTPETQPKSKAQATAKADPAVLKRLDALGDGGLLVGVLDGRGWAKVYQRLAPVLAKLPGAAPTELAQIATLPGLLNNLYKGLWRGETPLDLSALDANGSVVVSLFEPATFGPPGATAAHIGFDNGMVPLRHEIVLPATDAPALAASVLAGLKVTCMSAPHGCDFGELQIGVKADGNVVRIAALMPATVKDAETLLWAKPQPASVRTSSYLQLATPGAGLGLLIRPWRLRAVFSQEGANDMAFALREAPADVRQSLFANGLSMVLHSAQIMHTERPDFEDAVVRLSADDAGIAFEGTHVLTEATSRVFKTAVANGGRILALKRPVLAQTAQRIDFNALLNGVGPRPFFATVKNMRDFANDFQECGPGCLLHTATRVPFGTGRVALDMAPPEVKAIVRALPSAMQSALVRLDKHAKPIAAFAGDVAKDFDTGQLRAFEGAEVHLIPKNDRAVLLVGIGIDPRTVFDVQAATTPTLVSSARIESATLNQIAQLMGAGPITPVFNALGPITADSALAPGGHAFAWRLHLNTSPGVAASPFAPAKTTAFKGPILGYAPSKGDRCLRDVIAGTSKIFEALASVAPDQRAQLISQGFVELAPNFKCAAAHPSTKPAAAGIRRLFVQMVGIGLKSGETAAALTFVEGQCAQTKDAWICGEVKRIKTLPPPAPLNVAPPSNPFGSPVSGLAIDSPLLDVMNNTVGEPLGLPSSMLHGELKVGELTDVSKSFPLSETRDKTLIQMVVRSRRKHVQYCYEKALVKNPALAGKAMLSFTITPEGKVSDAVSTGETLPADVHTCIAKRTKTWSFIPAKTKTKVKYPFIFKSK